MPKFWATPAGVVVQELTTITPATYTSLTTGSVTTPSGGWIISQTAGSSTSATDWGASAYWASTTKWFSLGSDWRIWQPKQTPYQARKAREADRAAARARRLLVENISEDQRRSLEEHGYFEVNVGGRTYRIREGSHGNVRRVENGLETTSFCAQPNGVPTGDSMLAQKLMLETNEAEFLRIANARALGR